VLGIGGAKSLGEQVADTMKLAVDDVQTLVIPGCGHHPPEEGVPGPGAENPTDMWARSAGIITRQARHRAGLAGLRWRVR